MRQRLGVDTPAALVAMGALLAAPLVAYAVVNGPKMIAGAAIVAVIGSVLLKRPHWGVYLMMLGAFFDAFYLPVGFAALGVGDFAAFAALPVWLVHRLLRPAEIRLPAYWPMLVCFLAFTTASMVLGVKPSLAYGAYTRLVVYVLALIAFVDLARNADVLERVAWVMAGCSTFHALMAVASYGGAGRVGGLVDQPNLLGALLALGALPAAGLLSREKRPHIRVALGLALALILFSILLTISRGTYISLSIAFLWWMRRYRRMALVGIAAAGIVVTFVKSEQQSDRVEHIGRRFQMQDSSVRNRWQVMKNAVSVIAQRPLFGVGFNQFVEMHRAVEINRERRRGSHNFYLGVAAASGLPAMVCLFGFAFLQGRRLWRARARADKEDPDGREAWLISIFQALIIYHSISLAVRGGTRITEWAVLGCYCCASYLVAKPPTDTSLDLVEKPPAV